MEEEKGPLWLESGSNGAMQLSAGLGSVGTHRDHTSTNAPGFCGWGDTGVQEGVQGLSAY